jgi:hypothetical protein
MRGVRYKINYLQEIQKYDKKIRWFLMHGHTQASFNSFFVLISIWKSLRIQQFLPHGEDYSNARHHYNWSKINGGCIMHATSVEGSPWRHIDQRGLVSRLVTSALVWVFILPLYALPSCSKFSVSIPLFPTYPSMFILDDFIWYYVTWNIMYRPLYIVFRFHWLAFSMYDWCRRYALAELSRLSPFAANITDCCCHCCCAAAMAILLAIKASPHLIGQ